MENFKPEDVLYQITVEDVLEVAEHLGIPVDKVDDAVIAFVKESLEFAFENWHVAVENALTEASVKFSLS